MSLSEDVMAAIRSQLSTVRSPAPHQAVHNDECMYSFDTPASDEGLYVSLSTFHGFGGPWVDADRKRTKNRLYLHIKHVMIPKKASEEAPTNLGVGVQGGFSNPDDKFDTEKHFSLVVFPELSDTTGSRAVIPLPCSDLPMSVTEACDAIIAHASASVQEEVTSWSEEPIKVSKYAENLEQLNNGKKIPSDPSQWQCEDSGLKENLWLNLSTGYIGSGRKNWDGTGGTGAALKHFEETGEKYPLTVKLGTITAKGADVFSYAKDENDMVEDPKLAEHLAHWGINIMEMTKTERTQAEMEIELNRTYEFDAVTENGANLIPVTGPGYVGLKNMGATCYLASIMQVLFTIPEFAQQYLAATHDLASTGAEDVVNGIIPQVVKLAAGLLTDRYAAPVENEGVHSVAVTPRSFKAVVGKGHPEFSRAGQQDAGEFFQHFISTLSRAERGVSGVNGFSSSWLFDFETEERLQCLQSGGVRYSSGKENMLQLPIPLDKAVNKPQDAAEQESKRQKTGKEGTDAPAQTVPFQQCLDDCFAAGHVPDFLSPATGVHGAATKRIRFKSFPKILVVQLRRYVLGENWVPKKISAEVPVPDRIDLSPLRGTGQQPGEEQLPENAEAPAAEQSQPSISPDELLVSQLMSMGFSENRCKRAAIAVKNSGVEQAMEWVFQHMEDADVDSPIEESAPSAAPVSGGEVDVSPLTAMGFSDEQAKFALKNTQNNVERAADWLFSHMDDLDALMAADSSAAAPASGGDSQPTSSRAPSDGNGQYELFGIVSHIGQHTGCGHYVAHILKDGQWTLFNDRKVARSENPPKGLGYLYFFRRLD